MLPQRCDKFQAAGSTILSIEFSHCMRFSLNFVFCCSTCIASDSALSLKTQIPQSIFPIVQEITFQQLKFVTVKSSCLLLKCQVNLDSKIEVKESLVSLNFRKIKKILNILDRTISETDPRVLM